MELRDFRTLAAAGVIDQVVLHRRLEDGGYELWAFSDCDDWPRHLGNRLKVSRTNTERTWNSVDRALKIIRAEGWTGTVEVEEPVWMP